MVYIRVDKIQLSFPQGHSMDRQKMAEVVLSRMKERREEEERNRPEIQVIQMEAMFLIEKHHLLRSEIAGLEAELKESESLFERLESEGQELDNTGKKNFPRIIVLPEFIAAQRVQAKYKDFYRKSGNSFLRMDLLRKKGYSSSIEQEQTFINGSISVEELKQKVTLLVEEQTKNVNRRRLALLKQQLRLRTLKNEQRILREQIDADYEAHADLQREYQTKKYLVDNASQRMRQLNDQISHYKEMIEKRYNPENYRKFLGGNFPFVIRNQSLRKSLDLVRREIDLVKGQTVGLANRGKQRRSRSKKRQSTQEGSFSEYFSVFLDEGSRRSQLHRLKTQQIPKKMASMQTEVSLTLPHPLSQG